MNICVFCSSSDSLKPIYYEIADQLGFAIGSRGNNLIHGGGKIGLMGTVARAVQRGGGEVTGVIPERLNMHGVVSQTDDELIITPDMKERKATMHRLSDAFITLPGGFGTLEEVLEILTLKQLKYHSKPIVFVNIDNFYKNLFEQFEVLFEEKFTKADFRRLYHISENPKDALKYIEEYEHENIIDKWL